MCARRMAFREWFGLSPAEADILAALYEAQGAIRSAFRLAQSAAIKTGSVAFHICSLRQALETEAIDTERMGGYYLTDTGMAECRAALWQMGEELRKAS